MQKTGKFGCVMKATIGITILVVLACLLFLLTKRFGRSGAEQAAAERTNMPQTLGSNSTTQSEGDDEINKFKVENPRAWHGITIASNYIEGFRLSSSRVPSREEFMEWLYKNLNNLDGVCDYNIDPKETNEYMLSIWLGERMAGYSSKSKRIVEQQ